MNIESKLIKHIKKNIANEQEENDLFDLPEESHIVNKIEILKAIAHENLAIFFDAKPDDFKNVDWDRILRTVLEEILVKYEPGKGLIDDSEEYDKQWFSKLKFSDKYDNYYTERFSECYKEKIGPQVRYTLSRDTESILNLCGSPARDTVKHIRGLVFGFVQSGKTLNYASVSNAALGAGYDMIVILAGSTNILREQTQKRINYDLIGQTDGKIVGVGKYNNIPAKKPICLTSPNSDFNTKEANAQTNGINLENIRVPVIAVIKKNVTPLKNLKEWLENQSGQGGILKKSLLLIDDESDYASINTKDEEDPTSINKGIRGLLNSFDVSTYLAVTATPFANILINHELSSEEYGLDLFPRSFIWALDKPETYLGVNETLGDSFVDIYNLDAKMDADEVESEIRFVLTAKKDDSFEKLPYYVKFAVCRFLYDSTCLRKERSQIDHLSMLVNISRLTNHHIEISGLIQEFIDDLYRIIRNSSLDRVNNRWLKHIKDLANQNLHEFISLNEFWQDLETSMSITEIFDIHQRTKVPILYSSGIKRNSILVGGLSLSRGYTVEGLITSIFIRTTKTFDTLMQMGRWFGHKRHIIKYLSVFTTPTIRNRFELIEDSIIDLLEQIDEMKKLKLPPKDFGLNIRRHPNVLIETAVRELRSRQGLDVVSASKKKHAHQVVLKLSLGNRIMETVRFLNNKESAFKNDQLVISFFNELNKGSTCFKYSPINFPSLFIELNEKDKILGFLDVPNILVKEFINNYALPNQKLSDFSAKLPLRFILEFLDNKDNENLRWDVSLVTGGETDIVNICGNEYKKVKRSMVLAKDEKSFKIPKNQLSIPLHEFRFLNDDQSILDDNRSRARHLRKIQTGKPLLLIYPIKPISKDDKNLDLSIFENINLWGWSISMPGTNNDEDNVSVLANSVFFKELMEDYNEEFEDEDN